MNNSNSKGRTFEVSFTRSASRDVRTLMCNDINTFDFFLQRTARRSNLNLKNAPELMTAVEILKMEVTYN